MTKLRTNSNSIAGVLAKMLSERTGATFEIHHAMVPHSNAPGARLVRRYALRAARTGPNGPYTHHFQAHRPMPYGELVRWLASILDMIDMGFIPVTKPDLPAEPLPPSVKA